MFRKFENIGDPVLVISHPRSGTHLTIDLLRKNYIVFRSWKYPFEPLHTLYLPIEGFLAKDKSRLTEKIALKILSRPIRPIIKMHTYSYDALSDEFPEWIDWIDKKAKIIYVTRDPRSMLVSYQEYAGSFEPNTHVPFSEFIRQPYCGRENRIEYWSQITRFWINKKNTLTLRYEDILQDTINMINKISDFVVEKPIQKRYPLPVKIKNIWQFRAMRLLVHPESTALLGTKSKKYQSGWKQLLDDSDIEFIRMIAGREMASLGYQI